MGLFGKKKPAGSLSKAERAELAAEFAGWAPKNKVVLKRRLTAAGLAALGRFLKSQAKEG